MIARLLLTAALLGAAFAPSAHAERAGGATPPAAAAQAKISSGGLGSCAVAPTATAQCWGNGYDGQLLTGSEDDLGDDPGEGPVPIFLGRGVQVATVSYASSHACALDTTGALFCWGRNIYGQLGNTSRGNSTGDEPGDRAVRVPIAAASQVATGDEHTCAILTVGDVWCWGSNIVGQLGRGSASDGGENPGPVDLGGLKATSISARGAHTCAQLENGELRCWGSNAYGESGVVPAAYGNNVGDQPGEKPVKVTVLMAIEQPIKAMALGDRFTCVINNQNAVRCWGNGAGGALSTGNTNTVGDTPGEFAASVSTGVGAVGIAAGTESACAVRTDGELRCWGRNTESMLGTGLLGNNWGDSAGETTPLAVPLGAGRTAAAISIGIRHMCALTTTGQPLCWGASDEGQWGTGENSADDSLPGNNVKAEIRKAVSFSAALPDADADGLPDRFDACPAAASTSDDGCPAPAPPAIQPTTPVGPPVTPPAPPKSDWPVTLSASKVAYDVLLQPKKGKGCPAKATLKIRVALKTKVTKTVKLKKTGKGKTLRCRASGTAKLKAAPDGGTLVTAKFTGTGLKSQTVIAERVS